MVAPEVLWSPPPDVREGTRVGAYLRFLEEKRSLSFPDYRSLWQWSVSDLESFWSSVWDFFEVRAATPYETVLTGRVMPGTRWFPGATLNYAEHLVAGAGQAGDGPVVISRSQTRGPVDLSAAALADQTDLVEIRHTLHQVLNYKGT